MLSTKSEDGNAFNALLASFNWFFKEVFRSRSCGIASTGKWLFLFQNQKIKKEIKKEEHNGWPRPVSTQTTHQPPTQGTYVHQTATPATHRQRQSFVGQIGTSTVPQSFLFSVGVGQPIQQRLRFGHLLGGGGIGHTDVAVGGGGHESYQGGGADFGFVKFDKPCVHFLEIERIKFGPVVGKGGGNQHVRQLVPQTLGVEFLHV